MSHFPFHYAKQILLKIIQMWKQFWGEIEQMPKPHLDPAYICLHQAIMGGKSKSEGEFSRIMLLYPHNVRWLMVKMVIGVTRSWAGERGRGEEKQLGLMVWK